MKEYFNVLDIKNRQEFRLWLQENHKKEQECYIQLKRGKPVDQKVFYYLDAVEEALCFGWIDSTLTSIDGIRYQRFSKRGKNSNWTELNKERARRLIRFGLMREAGFQVLPDIEVSHFKVDEEIKDILTTEGVWEDFCSFPPLYQRIRLSNLEFYKKRNKEEYKKMLEHTISTTKNKETFGEWNDYGRLLED